CQLLGVREQNRPEPAPGAAPAEARVYRLDRLLQLDARRGGRGEPVATGTIKLFTEQMSVRSILFRSGRGLREGEELEIQLLLRADCSVTLRGKILWLHSGPQGLSGQLDLVPTAPEVEAEIAAYLEHRSRH
ncbi:MAG: hypothetical protein AB1758_13875, partial [Candidatus Eremiobacterota bacterium]